MLLRPYNVLTVLSITACALFITLICAVLYGTRTENPQLPNLVKEVLPAGRCQCEFSTTFTCDTCLDCANSQLVSPHAAEEAEERPWVFRYPRDADNYSLDRAQCQAAFPGLFQDLERGRQYRKSLGTKVSEDELDSFELSKGMVRALVFNGELYIIETAFVDNVNREKAIAALASLHRALISSPSRSTLPNVEFIISVEDLPAQPNKPVWGLARRAQDEMLWLLPDFGFWSWDMPEIGTFDEVAAEAVQRERELGWDMKREKLVWRGKITYAPKLRRALVDAAKGKSWSDVGQLRWGEADFKDRFLGPVDQCGYMFIAHAEGRSYSGALKYRQLCRSVIVSHKLQWIQHYHYLLKSSGPNQNYVEVERDFSDLEAAMEDLLSHPEKAKRIADNSVRVFRERYLTPAAEACYWRELVKVWSEVSFEPVLYEGPGEDEGDSKKHKKQKKMAPKGRRRGVRYETFMIYEPSRQMAYPKSAHSS